MEFANDLIDRIRKQIGLELASDEAFSLLQPEGNEHLVQFFIKNLSEEYLEFDRWDKHHLFLCELTAGLEFEFVLDDDGRFASLKQREVTQGKTIEAVMDLRDDYLITVYYFGDSKIGQRVNQMLTATEKIVPCHVSVSILEQLICELESITRLEFDFEQLQSSFLEPVVLKGTVNGDPAQTLYGQYLQNLRPYFNIKQICGHLTDDAQGCITFGASGVIQADDCRLSDFIKIVNQLYLLLRMKYKCLLEKCLVRWESLTDQSSVQLQGNLIEIWLGSSVDKLDGLLRFLTRGDRALSLLGIMERVSRKLWSIKSVHVTTGARIEIELSANMLRIYLLDRQSIPLFDKIEEYLQKHVTLDFENLLY